MKINRIFKTIYLLPVWAILFFSCTEDTMDRINENPNNPEDMQSRFIITDVMVKTAFSVTGTDYAFYASSYMEHNVGIYNQLYNAEVRITEPIASSTYNNVWETSYENIYHLNIILKKCSDGGTETGNYHTLGIAQVLQAYNLAVLTDVMGDTPWSEAGMPGEIYQPKLDTQEKIYQDIVAFLDQAIVNFGKESSYASLDAQDIIYKGDIAKWEKAAWGLKARYAMRLSLRNAQYQHVIDCIGKSFSSSADQLLFTYNGTTTNSPFYKFFIDRDYFGASQSLHDKLTVRNDPRDGKFFKSYPGTASLIFAPNGKPEQQQKKYGISALSTPTAPTYLLSYHELQFLKAEAHARLNQPAEALAALQEALNTAFVKVGLTKDDAAAYFQSIQDLLTTNLLKEIMVQKYLAFFEEESIETYNDYRRLKAMGDAFIDLGNTAKFPLRYTYGSSDVTTNNHIYKAYGDGNYVYTENVWWAGGTR